MKEEIIKKYKNVVVGRDNLNREIHIDKIMKEEDLKDFLYNMYSSRDESLTREGLEFLEEYYGLDRITDIIMTEKESGIDYSFKDKEEIINWLNQFKKFE